MPICLQMSKKFVNQIDINLAKDLPC